MALGFGCLAAMSLHAIPAQKGIWRTMTLQDGTEVYVELQGDEFMSYWQDKSGNRYMQTDKGLVAADMQMLVQRADGLRTQAQGDKASLLTKDGRRRLKKAASYKGDKRCLIILVQFADKSFSMDDPKAFYNRVTNEKGFSEGNFKGCVADYFRDQSNGQFNLTFDVAGPYTLSNYADYGADSNGRHDVNVQAMISAACSRALTSGVDYSPYDWDNDGIVDLVYVLYAGEGQATGGSDDTIWPHKSSLSVPLKVGSKQVKVYACSNEIAAKNSIAGIGTICHEFSHCLGFPDYYDVNYGGMTGTGTWDIMCSGNYNGGGFQPAGYTAYEKIVAGWVDPITLDENTTVTGLKPLLDGGDAYIFRNPSTENEFYVIENRQKEGWDASLPGSGILINHVDYNATVWAYNYPNTKVDGINDHERSIFIPADNIRDDRTEAGDAWPYGSKNSLGNSTAPACDTYNANTNGVKKMNIGINNMAIAEDGTASFTFTNFNKSGSHEGYLLHETFDKCQGKGGNDNNGFTPPKVALDFAMGTFDPDCTTGWEGAFVKGACMCARIGSTSAEQAMLTSPEFVVDGTAKVSFMAAPYGSDGTSLKLSANNGAELGQSEFTMVKDQWTTFTTTVKGNGKVRLTFTGVRRYFLDEVSVEADGESAINGVYNDASNKKAGRIYTIGGVYVGNDTNLLPSGVYIVNGKKFVK